MTDWPQEIRKPHTANFKVRDEKKKHVSAQKRREGNDAAYLALIRQLPCCVPGCQRQPPVDPHHLKGGPAKQERAFGRRATDKWAVPMCRIHHDCLPVNMGDEPTWFNEVGLPSVYEMAEALWHSVRSLKAMAVIVLTHKLG